MKFLRSSILTIVILTVVSLFYSCSDDDETPPIKLKDREDTAIRLIYPATSETGYSFPIEGGDGNYSVKSSNNETVTAEIISSTDLRLKAIGIGETIVTITDNSKNTLVLQINVDYQTVRYVIKKHDIQVIGGDLTENEKKAIAEKYLIQIPVKVGGGYDFIHNDALNKKGKAIIYTENYGSKGQETTFSMVEVPKVPNLDGSSSTWGYEVNINDEKRVFVLDIYTPSTRGDMIVTVALKEDLRAKVQIEYPKAEFVYTSQVIERPKE